MDWAQLRTEFDGLRENMRFYRLDYQWGAVGTYYRLAGGGRSEATRRFEVLAGIAGRKLRELPPDSLNPAVHDESDAIAAWYEALRHHSGAFEIGIVGMQSDDAGNHMGNIYTGGVSQPAESSSLVCLQLSTIVQAAQVTNPATPRTAMSRVNVFFKREAEERGYIWLIIGFVVTFILGALAL